MELDKVTVWDQLPDLSWREKVSYLSYWMLKMPQGEAPVTHRFEPGLYVREIRIPADMVFIGRQHTYGHECRLVEGSLVLMTEQGKLRFDAPASIHSKADDVMVAYTITEVVAQSIHPDPLNSQDPDAIVDDVFYPQSYLPNLGERVNDRLSRLARIQAWLA